MHGLMSFGFFFVHNDFKSIATPKHMHLKQRSIFFFIYIFWFFYSCVNQLNSWDANAMLSDDERMRLHSTAFALSFRVTRAIYIIQDINKVFSLQTLPL